jgi:hypothetical protein
MDLATMRVTLFEVRPWSFVVLGFAVAWPASAAAEKPSEVVEGNPSKRVRRAAARSIDVGRQVIRGRGQKPLIVFTVKKVPVRFDVGTSRYSWRPAERRRAPR